MNWAVWGYVKKSILEKCAVQDLVVMYNYLNSIDYVEMPIWECIKAAKEYRSKQFTLMNKEKNREVKKPIYKDFTIGDFL